MHRLVGTDDGIHRTGFDAQGAANAPRLLNDRHRQWPLVTVVRIQRLLSVTGYCGQPGHPFLTTGRALVNGGLALINCLLALRLSHYYRCR